MGRKPTVSPSLTTKFPSEAVKTWDNPSKIFGHEKNPETLIFRGFLHVRWSRSALAELRCTTCRFEAVLARLFARNPCIYLAFELRHSQFPHSLTTDRILFLLVILDDSQLSSESVCSFNAPFTTSESSSGLLYLAFA